MWSKPYVIMDKYADEVVILILDTQGTFDHSSTMKECATIFALSTLLSSLQIFNVSKQIQEDDLQNLKFFTEYANLAQKRERNIPFQKMLFLVRDWPNSEQHDYGYEGGADYLDDILKPKQSQKRENQTLRKSIKSSFTEIMAFLMPHPGLRIARNNSNTVLGATEEEFKEQIDIFVPSLFEKNQIEAKKSAGSDITCGQLFHLFKAYMKIFNSEELPEPKSIFEATAKAALIAAEEKSKAEYHRILSEFTASHPTLSNISILQTVHETAKKCALELFDNKPKFGSEDLILNYRNRLCYGIDARYAELKQQVELRHMEEDRQKKLAEDRKKLEDQRKADEAKLAAEKEKLRKEAEELERKEEKRQKEEKEAKEKHRREEARLRQERENLASARNQRNQSPRREFPTDLLNLFGQIGQRVANGYFGPPPSTGYFPRQRSHSPPRSRGGLFSSYPRQMSNDYEFGPPLRPPPNLDRNPGGLFSPARDVPRPSAPPYMPRDMPRPNVYPGGYRLPGNPDRFGGPGMRFERSPRPPFSSSFRPPPPPRYGGGFRGTRPF